MFLIEIKRVLISMLDISLIQYRYLKKTKGSSHTVSKSSEYKSFKVLDFDAPPNIKRSLSSCSAATWFDLGEGPVPLNNKMIQ